MAWVTFRARRFCNMAACSNRNYYDGPLRA